MQRLPLGYYDQPNPNMLRAAQARNVLGMKNRKTMEKIAIHLPKLIFTDYPQKLRRYPLSYLQAAAEKFQSAEARDGAATLRAFGATVLASELLDSAKQDMYARIDEASSNSLIAVRDVAYVFNLGYVTATEWCNPEHGFIASERYKSHIYVLEDALRQSFTWIETE